MWATVVVMAFAVIFEPIRIGLAVLMLNRPRPLLQLLAFLCGGFTMGMGAGLTVLFVLRSTPLTSGRFSLPSIQITVGIIALTIAAVLACNIRAFKRPRRPKPAQAPDGAPRRLDHITARMRRTLKGESLWIAWVTGLGTALPSANFMGAIAVILASGETPVAQAQALLLFNIVAFTLVEIPLISYIAAPKKTQALLASLHAWLQSRQRRDMALVVAAGGCVLLGMGLVHL